MNYHGPIKERIAKHREFLSRKEPGDLLIFTAGNHSLEAYGCECLFKEGTDAILKPERTIRMVDDYVNDLRRDLSGSFYSRNDDSIPSALVYFGVGTINAALSGLDPFHDGNTSWVEPSLDWEQIDQLRFDPNNKWVDFALRVNQELWRRWDEEFMILPYLHRSPLDSANGVRGNELFLEMYTEPDRVKALIDWCADWSISIEQFIADNVTKPDGWGTGCWNCWLPDDAVFVNGDPVGLISPEMQKEFEQPYTEKLFTARGGGFFHNHTIGLYQVLNVARTRGILIQNFVPDSKEMSVEAALLSKDHRDDVLEASLLAPIHFWLGAPEELDKLLPILAEGRFIIGTWSDDPELLSRTVQAVHKASKLQ